MNNFVLITTAIFSIVAIMHLLRLVNKWKVTLGPWKMPMWTSVVGICVAGYMAYWGYLLM